MSDKEREESCIELCDQWCEQAGLPTYSEVVEQLSEAQARLAQAEGDLTAIRNLCALAGIDLSAPVSPAAQAAVKESLTTGERAAAEETYTRRAFDYEQNPVGSRDWTLFWAGWCARAVQSAQPVSDAYKSAAQAVVSVGDSFFESWYSLYNPEGKSTKQTMREAYEAGMVDHEGRCDTAAQAVADDEHVAWLRYNDHNGQRPTTLHLCDSDAPGAFKVFRAAQAVADDVVLVPKVPTTDMLLAGAKVMFSRIRGDGHNGVIAEMYSAMLAAQRQNSQE